MFVIFAEKQLYMQVVTAREFRANQTKNFERGKKWTVCDAHFKSGQF